MSSCPCVKKNKQINIISFITENNLKTPWVRTRDIQKKTSSADALANQFNGKPGSCAENSFKFFLLRSALSQSIGSSETIFERFDS